MNGPLLASLIARQPVPSHANGFLPSRSAAIRPAAARRRRRRAPRLKGR